MEDATDGGDAGAAARTCNSAGATNEESLMAFGVGDICRGHMNVHELAAEQLNSTMAEVTGGSGRSLGELQRIIASVESSARRDSAALSVLRNELTEGGGGGGSGEVVRP